MDQALNSLPPFDLGQKGLDLEDVLQRGEGEGTGATSWFLVSGSPRALGLRDSQK